MLRFINALLAELRFGLEIFGTAVLFVLLADAVMLLL
jgi:hypothetical protein